MTSDQERHGQGGDCGYLSSGFYYHNAFLIVDATEAWTVGPPPPLWVGACLGCRGAVAHAPPPFAFYVPVSLVRA